MKKLFPILACVCFSTVNLFSNNLNSDINSKIADAKNHIDAYLEIKKNNYQIRALELSLYYQGFSPNIIGNYDKYGADEKIFNNLPKDEDLKKHIVMRDAKKAFFYALIAYKSEEYVTYNSSNLANLVLQGIGTQKNIGRAREILDESKLFRMPISDIQRCEFGAYRFRSFKFYEPLIAYMYHHGLGVEKDEMRCEAILNEVLGDYAWRNFYCGFMVPKDFNFAIHCLERRKEFWAARILSDIYSGKYLLEHTNNKKAEHWKKIEKERVPLFEEEMKNYYKNNLKWEKNNRPKAISNIRHAVYLGFKIAYVSFKWKYEDMPFKNPFYDLEKAKSLLEDAEKECANNPEEKKDFAEELERASRKHIELSLGGIIKYEGEIFDHLEKLAKKYKN